MEQNIARRTGLRSAADRYRDRRIEAVGVRCDGDDPSIDHAGCGNPQSHRRRGRSVEADRGAGHCAAHSGEQRLPAVVAVVVAHREAPFVGLVTEHVDIRIEGRFGEVRRDDHAVDPAVRGQRDGDPESGLWVGEGDAALGECCQSPAVGAEEVDRHAAGEVAGEGDAVDRSRGMDVVGGDGPGHTGGVEHAVDQTDAGAEFPSVALERGRRE